MSNQELSQEQRSKVETLKEKFKTACRAEPLTPQFAETCTSAVALLARTISSAQMINEVFNAICSGREGFSDQETLEKKGKEILSIIEGMDSAECISLLSRVLTTAVFDEYVIRLNIEQSKH